MSALPDYETISRALGVRHCPACPLSVHGPGGQTKIARGYADAYTGEIHWDSRRPTRAGIYRFLRLVAELQTERPGQPLWAHRYRALRTIPELSKTIRVQLPRSMGDPDRLALRAMLVNVPRNPLRDEAMEWAGRRS